MKFFKAAKFLKRRRGGDVFARRPRPRILAFDPEAGRKTFPPRLWWSARHRIAARAGPATAPNRWNFPSSSVLTAHLGPIFLSGPSDHTPTSKLSRFCLARAQWSVIIPPVLSFSALLEGASARSECVLVTIGKLMKSINKAAIGFLSTCGICFSLHSQPVFESPELQLVAPQEVPLFGTFWLQGPNGLIAPLPFVPEGMSDSPVYEMSNGQFLIGQGLSAHSSMLRSSVTLPPPPGGGGLGTPPPPPPPDARRTYQKFALQTFTLLDTNIVWADASLSNACRLFPADTHTYPTLQIRRYGQNMVLIKANHFDYSLEDRNFALLVTDQVGAPVWRSVDLLRDSDSQDGWLVQGAVQSDQVTDPMFMLISNIVTDVPAFYRAIAYAGPIVALTGPAQYSVVGGIVQLHATISDLSGTVSSNQQITVTVNGLPARGAITANNTVSIDTRYAPAGAYQTIGLTFSSLPTVVTTHKARHSMYHRSTLELRVWLLILKIQCTLPIRETWSDQILAQITFSSA
jgi:hypothetical protein